MKKYYGFAFLVLLFVSCKNSFTVSNSEVIKKNRLPNGIILSTEKEQELLEFTKSFCMNSEARNLIENEDDIEIDEQLEKDYIEALKKQYGKEAELYYGEELVYYEDKEIPCIYDQEIDMLIPFTEASSSRNIHPIDLNYIIKSKISCKKHWGLWWQYFTYEVNLVVESKYTTEKNNLKTDKAFYEYTDSVTNKSGWEDWTKFDNPSENGYPTGNSKADIRAQIEWAIAEANRGVLDIKGNTKIGWLPKVSNSSLHVIWYDDFIAGGEVGVIYSAK